MTEFRVTWTIDIDADTPEQAAEKARQIQVRPGSTATVFEVQSSHEVEVQTVDIEGDNCRYCGHVIVEVDGYWVSTDATGDDSIWRTTCPDHDTFQAEHEPAL